MKKLEVLEKNMVIGLLTEWIKDCKRGKKTEIKNQNWDEVFYLDARQMAFEDILAEIHTGNCALNNNKYNIVKEVS